MIFPSNSIPSSPPLRAPCRGGAVPLHPFASSRSDQAVRTVNASRQGERKGERIILLRWPLYHSLHMGLAQANRHLQIFYFHLMPSYISQSTFEHYTGPYWKFCTLHIDNSCCSFLPYFCAISNLRIPPPSRHPHTTPSPPLYRRIVVSLISHTPAFICSYLGVEMRLQDNFVNRLCTKKMISYR